jgi:hypothetical protein
LADPIRSDLFACTPIALPLCVQLSSYVPCIRAACVRPYPLSGILLNPQPKPVTKGMLTPSFITQVIPVSDNQEKEQPISKKSIVIIVGVFGVFALLSLLVTLFIPSRY